MTGHRIQNTEVRMQSLGPREMIAHWVKCWPDKHEDLSSDQHPLSAVKHAEIPVLEVVTGGFLELTS